MSNLATHTATKAIVEKYGFNFTKSLGQNFLVDGNILRKIVDGADIGSDDIVFEIGTGIGTLTSELARRAKKVVAIEIDSRLIPILSETLSEFDNVEIINQDILKVDLPALVREHSPDQKIKVVANLPYYITTPIIMRFLEEGIALSSMVIMIQKEVADRIAAKPSTKAYGSLSVAIQYYAESKIIAEAPKEAFVPSPNVDSAVLKIDVKQDKGVDLMDSDLFFEVVKGSFSKRRKTILNSLSTYGDFEKEIIEKALEASGIDPKRRGETLTILEFASLSNQIYCLRRETPNK